MKKYIRSAVLAATVLIFSFTNGCDAFESFPINIPFSIEFEASGSSNNISDTGSGCLDTNSETYIEYKNKIQSLTFVEAAYRTISINGGNQNVTGNINVTVRVPGGATLFSYTINNVRPADYLTSAFVLQLNEQELGAVRNYLQLFESLPAMCFEATYTLSNLTGGTPPYTIKGAVDFVLEAETEL